MAPAGATDLVPLDITAAKPAAAIRLVSIAASDGCFGGAKAASVVFFLRIEVSLIKLALLLQNIELNAVSPPISPELTSEITPPASTALLLCEASPSAAVTTAAESAGTGAELSILLKLSAMPTLNAAEVDLSTNNESFDETTNGATLDVLLSPAGLTRASGSADGWRATNSLIHGCEMAP